MAVTGVNSPQTPLSPNNLAPVKPGNTGDPFQALLNQASTQWESAKPSSPQAKMQLEMVKSMVQMELLNLNTTLISALGGGGSGGGSIGLGDAGMSGLMKIVQMLQIPDSTADDSQKTDDPEQRASKIRKKLNELSDELEEEDVRTDKTANFLIDIRPDASIEEIIQKTAAAHDMDPDLVRAVVKTESNFNPRAVSSAGAMGLMQLMPSTASDLGVDSPFDPAQNVSGGTRYLKQMLQRYAGDVSQALAAYNWGPGNLDNNRGSGFMPDETRNYIRIVTDYYRRFKNDSSG